MKAPTSRRARQQGFTLIEVLVAVSLMALVSLIAWRGLQRVADTRDLIQQQAADTDQVIRALGQLARDVEVSYTGPAFEAASTDAIVLNAGLRLNARRLGKPVLDIVRPDPDGAGLWQRVQWRVDKQGLWRAIGPAAAVMPLPDPVDAVLLLPDVTALTVRAWLPNAGWTNTDRALAAAPEGLELAVQRGEQQRYTRVVELP